MKIDWFTFAAQIVNFFVLVVILRHVLYRPILEALDARRRAVEATVADAAAAKEAAEKDRNALAGEREAFAQRKAELHRRLEEEIETERARLTDETRRELEELNESWKQRIEQEKAEAGRMFAELAGDELVAVTRRLIRDLSDTELEEAMVRAFIRRWRETPDDERQRRAGLLRSGAGEILVRTSSGLPEKLQNDLTRLLTEDAAGTPASPVCRFETASELLGGIEVWFADRRITWSCAEYLAALETRMHDLLAERTP
ncbi:MAG TPA: hypothetical protein PLP29_02090 [Candidatus Ozemobacteraceae bacterium]|nr:hypothetical protein [Candidatus Ozemobacteraceae bacterium]